MDKTKVANYLWDLGGKIGRPCRYPFWWLSYDWILDTLDILLGIFLTPFRLIGLGACHILLRTAWYLDKKRQRALEIEKMKIELAKWKEEIGPPGTI